MKKDEKLISVDEVIEGTAQFEGNENYVKNENGGYSLKADLLEKVNAEAKHRWENGGKEVYEKLNADPTFAETDEYKNYFKKWGIPNPNS